MNRFKLNLKILNLILRLTSIHSAIVGIGLIIIPSKALSFFGYSLHDELFFRVQGGVFHLVMAVAYWMASNDRESAIKFCPFFITAKFMATVFLLIYYFFNQQIWVVVFSAIVDMLMGIIILIYFNKIKKV